MELLIILVIAALAVPLLTGDTPQHPQPIVQVVYDPTPARTGGGALLVVLVVLVIAVLALSGA